MRYTVPDIGAELVNIAELEELSADECSMVRMIELDPKGVITGIYVEHRVIGQANEPSKTVPHPDTYHRYAGITARRIAATEFEGLWQEALQKFGQA
ncbi:hypothetical protein C3E79_11105 [Corynebacterium liangguodongii]|uniref:Uncharacterized protein n=2 Tax=Corynebacterium liangguodongii TaxID=2079535 RepID=A0A2S0WHD0_9CORY|nr:hypothetical protein C3E79_11105 [Corynebacterium liangguodongii]PWB99418.1 hypothetical protein DF219_07170 [Corynebacterium liangguodongii]